jgi:GNAT superfamily N-acetyltransferase
MNYYFSQEKWVDYISEAMPLLTKHWLEISNYKDIILNVDHNYYQTMEDEDSLRIFTARDEATNEMVGYLLYTVGYNPHYKDSLQASVDVVYIDPERRGFGMKFMKWCDERLKQEGVEIVYHHVKLAHDFGPVLKRMGYKPIETIYGKRFSDADSK